MVYVSVTLSFLANVTMYALVAGPLTKMPYRAITGKSWVQWVATENIKGRGIQSIHPNIITFFLSKRSAIKPPGIMVRAVLKMKIENREPTSADEASKLLM